MQEYEKMEKWKEMDEEQLFKLYKEMIEENNKLTKQIIDLSDKSQKIEYYINQLDSFVARSSMDYDKFADFANSQ